MVEIVTEQFAQQMQILQSEIFISFYMTFIFN